jgi:hypothetical protein
MERIDGVAAPRFDQRLRLLEYRADNREGGLILDQETV